MNQSERSYNFVKSLEFTLPWECGKDKSGNLRHDVHWLDQGLPTKYGIWQGANPDLDVPNLTLEQAIEVYKDRYWLPYLYMKGGTYVNMDVVEIGIAVALFDTGVNVGVPRAWGWYKPLMNEKDPALALLAKRGVHYASLRSSQPQNYNGWMNRLNDLKKYVAVLRAA